MVEVPIRIPRVSTAAFEATLVDVLVPDGGTVNQDEALFVVETDKVEVEIPAATSGVVHWSAPQGNVYAVGEEIGFIETDG